LLEARSNPASLPASSWSEPWSPAYWMTWSARS